MVKQSGIIHIVPKTESWRVSDVLYRGETKNYELVGEMTSAMPQDKLVARYGLEIPSVPLIWAIASRAYDFRNENIEEVGSLRDFLRNGFRQFPNTSSKVIYNPSGFDKVIHNHGTSDQYSLNANVVGPNDWIENILDKSVLESLLGTNDINRINKVSNWINETDTYLWRLNSKPSKKDERVVGFSAYSDGLGLSAAWDPLDEYPAFRVLQVE
ncbi:MAG: hypothetical protein KKB31_00075 [Nanoarchaeota archaeon]|nr:hypothetical protein [Nanoarchaeota archaeon]